MLFDADMVDGQARTTGEHQPGKNKQPPTLPFAQGQGDTDQRDEGDAEIGDAFIKAEDAGLETECELADQR